MAGKSYSKIQPQDCNTVMLCGDGDEKHAFFLSQPVKFQRPDGTIGKSSWIICCYACYLKYEIEGIMPDIKKDGLWKGNEPEFYHIFT